MAWKPGKPNPSNHSAMRELSCDEGVAQAKPADSATSRSGAPKVATMVVTVPKQHHMHLLPHCRYVADMLHHHRSQGAAAATGHPSLTLTHPAAQGIPKPAAPILGARQPRQQGQIKLRIICSAVATTSLTHEIMCRRKAESLQVAESLGGSVAAGAHATHRQLGHCFWLCRSARVRITFAQSYHGMPLNP